MPERGLRSEERTIDIDGHHLLLVGIRVIFDRIDDLDAGIRHEDIDRTELRRDTLDTLIDRIFVVTSIAMPMALPPLPRIFCATASAPVTTAVFPSSFPFCDMQTSCPRVNEGNDTMLCRWVRKLSERSRPNRASTPLLDDYSSASRAAIVHERRAALQHAASAKIGALLRGAPRSFIVSTPRHAQLPPRLPAGNHADVLKHAIVVQMLRYLGLKDKLYWYIDKHSGAGVYLLTEGFVAKNAEYESGIARL